MSSNPASIAESTSSGVPCCNSSVSDSSPLMRKESALHIFFNAESSFSSPLKFSTSSVIDSQYAAPASLWMVGGLIMYSLPATTTLRKSYPMTAEDIILVAFI